MSRASTSRADRPTRLLRDRLRAFFHELPGALAGKVEPVHQMRVAGRRLRVVLPLVARKPEGARVRRARRILRGMIRAAGACRDLDVGLALLDEHAGSAAAPSPGLRRLRRRLRAARTRSRSRMTGLLLDQELSRLRRDLRAILARGGAAPATVNARMREARDLGGEALLSSLEALGERFDPDALHRVRRMVRRLRYTAEAAGELGDGPSDAPKQWKRLQEHLGRIHDAYILAAWLGRAAAAAARRREPDVEAEARRLEAAFLERSRGHHRTWLEQDPVGTVKRILVLMGPAAPAPPEDAER